jgi:DNA-binding NarL/FixJ family response regulator
VLVVDDEMLVRAGLRAVIESDPGLHVVADVPDAARAVEAALRHQPRLAIVGAHGSALDGVELTRQLRAACPETAVVLLARLDDGGALVDGLRAGALGFVRMSIERLELLSVLHRAIAGESVIDPDVAMALVARMAAQSDLAADVLPEPLTPRETEILQRVARGETNPQIARELILAVGTIKVHVEHILGKLGVSDRTQAAVRGVELGLVGGEEPARAPGRGSPTT